MRGLEGRYVSGKRRTAFRGSFRLAGGDDGRDHDARVARCHYPLLFQW